jgi:hypothetical protein
MKGRSGKQKVGYRSGYCWPDRFSNDTNTVGHIPWTRIATPVERGMSWKRMHRNNTTVDGVETTVNVGREEPGRQ